MSVIRNLSPFESRASQMYWRPTSPSLPLPFVRGTPTGRAPVTDSISSSVTSVSSAGGRPPARPWKTRAPVVSSFSCVALDVATRLRFRIRPTAASLCGSRPFSPPWRRPRREDPHRRRRPRRHVALRPVVEVVVGDVVLLAQRAERVGVVGGARYQGQARGGVLERRS